MAGAILFLNNLTYNVIKLHFKICILISLLYSILANPVHQTRFSENQNTINENICCLPKRWTAIYNGAPRSADNGGTEIPVGQIKVDYEKQKLLAAEKGDWFHLSIEGSFAKFHSQRTHLTYKLQAGAVRASIELNRCLYNGKEIEDGLLEYIIKDEVAHPLHKDCLNDKIWKHESTVTTIVMKKGEEAGSYCEPISFETYFSILSPFSQKTPLWMFVPKYEIVSGTFKSGIAQFPEILDDEMEACL